MEFSLKTDEMYLMEEYDENYINNALAGLKKYGYTTVTELLDNLKAAEKRFPAPSARFRAEGFWALWGTFLFSISDLLCFSRPIGRNWKGES